MIGRSQYRERLYLCSAAHETTSWQWDTVRKIKCGTRGCRRVAHLSIYANAAQYHTAPRPIYFENGSGDVLLPGSASDLPPAGFEIRRIENCYQRDKFYAKMNKQLRAEHEAYVEQEQAGLALAQSENRSELRRAMEQGIPEYDDATGELTGRLRPMTAFERDMAIESMSTSPQDIRRELERIAQTNPAVAEKLEQIKRSKPLDRSASFDPGFFNQAWEYDRSNRNPYNDAETGYKNKWY